MQELRLNVKNVVEALNWENFLCSESQMPQAEAWRTKSMHSEVDDCDEELSMFALAGSCGSRLLSDIQCILC